jgi:hypothetical protein
MFWGILKQEMKEDEMRSEKMTAVALAVLLCGGMLSAAPEHAGKKEGYSQRTEGKRTMRSERSEKTRQRVSKPQREKRPEVRHRTDKKPKIRGRIVTPEARPQKFHPTKPKVVKREKHPHHRVRPGVRTLPPHHRPGHVVRRLPRVAVTLSLGGVLFYYAEGIYYRHYPSGFVVAVPPVGLIVPVLPVGYTVLRIHGGTYYYYADVYYVWDANRRAYRVVEAPQTYETLQPGDIVESLPDGAYTVTIDGVQYYRYGGIYFLQSVQDDRVVYVVVTP